MAIRSFYVVSWDAGQPLYNRTWVEVTDDPTLLSGLLASLELLALKVTAQHVNVVTLRDFRFFFKIDEQNAILLVFITDLIEEAARFYKYLDMLNKRFVETFQDKPYTTPLIQRDAQRVRVFDELVDSLVSNWESAEATLKAAKAMDVLDVFTLVYNTCLQKMLTKNTRNTYMTDIKDIFRKNVASDSALRSVIVDDHGTVSFDNVNPLEVDLLMLPTILFSILTELITLIRRTRRRQTYEALFFEHLVPLIKAQKDRLEAYELIADLVMELI